jgi:hypothetical protein
MHSNNNTQNAQVFWIFIGWILKATGKFLPANFTLQIHYAALLIQYWKMFGT